MKQKIQLAAAAIIFVAAVVLLVFVFRQPAEPDQTSSLALTTTAVTNITIPNIPEPTTTGTPTEATEQTVPGLVLNLPVSGYEDYLPNPNEPQDIPPLD